MSDLKLIKVDSRCFLEIGTEQIEVADYDLKSSASGDTELLVLIKGQVSELELSVSLEAQTGKKKAAPERQHFSYEPSIRGTIPEGQSKNILDEQIQEIKYVFNSLGQLSERHPLKR